jgi:hypothetical protein
MAVAGVSAADQNAPACDKEVPPMRLWDQMGGAALRREADDDAWLAQYAEAPAWWWRLNRHGGRSPNHPTPYLDLIIPPCAAICLLISMYPEFRSW